MATVGEMLRGVSPYPIPKSQIEKYSLARGLDIAQVATASVIRSRAYRLTEADLQKWLSKAPSVSESGVSFSFSQSERDSLIREANEVYLEYGEITQETEFGYIGDSI